MSSWEDERTLSAVLQAATERELAIQETMRKLGCTADEKAALQAAANERYRKTLLGQQEELNRHARDVGHGLARAFLAIPLVGRAVRWLVT